MLEVNRLTHKSASLYLTVWDKKRATLHDFYAQDPGQGHGTKLLKKALRLCDQRKITVVLEVNSGYPERMSNKKLRKWYEKFGFVMYLPGDTPWMERRPK